MRVENNQLFNWYSTTKMRGIDTIEIDKLRRLHRRTVAARAPQQRDTTVDTTTTTTTSITATSTVTTSTTTHNGSHPMCPHCGTMIIPAPVATLPASDTPNIRLGDHWTVTASKRPICNARELHVLETELGLAALPEMVFGNNHIRVYNDEFQCGLEFNARDALGLVALEDCGIRVAYSKDWLQSKRQQQQQQEPGTASGGGVEVTEESLNIIHNYDWTYTTPYRGTLIDSQGHEFIRDDKELLPIDLLSRPDRILYFEDMILFEDELADNGISIMQCKIRVMDERLLLLNRFFLRVDDVLFRVIDTRVYVEFKTNKIVREWKWLESSYQDVKSKCGIHGDPSTFLRDSDWVAKHLPLKQRQCEYMYLNK